LEKYSQGTKETGRVPPAESTKDYWSYMKR